MDRRFLLLIFSALLAISCNDEQAAGIADTSTYIKFFGDANSNIAYISRQTPDGGSILLGTTKTDNEGIFVFKIKVIKVDKNGNTLWEKIYPDYTTANHLTVSLKGKSLLVVKDGYIIVGDSIKSDPATKSSLFVMKINDNPSDKSIVDMLALDYKDITGNKTPYHIVGLDIIEDSDGNFRTIGNVMDGSEILGTIFSKINADDLTFDSDCTYEIPGKLSLVKSLHETGDGDFIFGGTNQSAIVHNAILRQVPPCFKAQSGASSNIVTNPEDHYTASQLIATNTGYAMIGTHMTRKGDTDVFLALINSNGTVRTNYPRKYSDPDKDYLFTGLGNKNEQGLTIANTTDGGFIIGGNTLSETAGEQDILLIKTDPFGTIQWTNTIGSSNKESATHIRQASDGGYLIFGNTEFGGIDTMVLVKTDKNGNTH